MRMKGMKVGVYIWPYASFSIKSVIHMYRLLTIVVSQILYKVLHKVQASYQTLSFNALISTLELPQINLPSTVTVRPVKFPMLSSH